MRMRIAALAGNCVYCFDVFRTHIVENFAHEAHGLIFAHARLHGAIEFIVSGVDHHGGVVEQTYFIARFDQARFGHQCLPVDDFDSFFLQRE